MHSHVTLLVVDIDGVLNIGINDGQSAPLSCNERNLSQYAGLSEEAASLCSDASAQLLLAVANRGVDNDDSTYGALCKGPRDAELSDVYVRRLAQLIAAAKRRGPSVCVLSSSWRKHNTKGVRVLEQVISAHLNEPFAFHAQTDTREPKSPCGRLENISSFLANWSAWRGSLCDTVRVVVLEDFHIRPLNGWVCGGKAMSCPQDVESHLRQCFPSDMDAEVCLVHTYDHWTTRTGLALRVGCGLTSNHFNKALSFLEAGDEVTDECAIANDIPLLRTVTAPAPAYAPGEDEALAPSLALRQVVFGMSHAMSWYTFYPPSLSLSQEWSGAPSLS
jgi:hypothetical protein